MAHFFVDFAPSLPLLCSIILFRGSGDFQMSLQGTTFLSFQTGPCQKLMSVPLFLAKGSEDNESIKVRDWRHRLQKTFLSNKALPKEEVGTFFCLLSWFFGSFNQTFLAVSSSLLSFPHPVAPFIQIPSLTPPSLAYPLSLLRFHSYYPNRRWPTWFHRKCQISMNFSRQWKTTKAWRSNNSRCVFVVVPGHIHGSVTSALDFFGCPP